MLIFSVLFSSSQVSSGSHNVLYSHLTLCTRVRYSKSRLQEASGENQGRSDRTHPSPTAPVFASLASRRVRECPNAVAPPRWPCGGDAGGGVKPALPLPFRAQQFRFSDFPPEGTVKTALLMPYSCRSGTAVQSFRFPPSLPPNPQWCARKEL